MPHKVEQEEVINKMIEQMKEGQCKIYRINTSRGYSCKGGRYAYNHPQSSIRMSLTADQMRRIGLKEVVIDAKDLTIRMAGIDDRKTQKLRASMHLATEDDSICGKYELVKESQDLFRLVKVE